MGPLALFWAWPHSQLLEQEITAARERNQLVARTLAWSVERYHQDLLGAFNEAADGLIATDPKLPDRLAPRSLKMRHIVVADRHTGAIVTKFATARNLPRPGRSIRTCWHGCARRRPTAPSRPVASSTTRMLRRCSISCVRPAQI